MIGDDARDGNVEHALNTAYDGLSGAGTVQEPNSDQIRKVDMRRPYLEGDRADDAKPAYYRDDPRSSPSRSSQSVPLLKIGRPKRGGGDDLRKSVVNNVSWDE
jgi:hypothetical protein